MSSFYMFICLIDTRDKVKSQPDPRKSKRVRGFNGMTARVSQHAGSLLPCYCYFLHSEIIIVASIQIMDCHMSCLGSVPEKLVVPFRGYQFSKTCDSSDFYSTWDASSLSLSL